MKWAAVITAAGSSSRFAQGDHFKKELLALGDSTVIASSVAPFYNHQDCVVVVVTCSECFYKAMQEALKGFDLLFCLGGSSRAASIWQALQRLAELEEPPVYVLVHDGARPWVTTNLIDRILAPLPNCKAVIPVLPCQESLKELKDPTSALVVKHHQRQLFALAQTPQAFLFTELFSCYEQAIKEGVFEQMTDDSQLWAKYATDVTTVKGEPANRKITYPTDLPPRQTKLRIGHGYDTHQLTEGENLRLAGVDIPAKKSALAHSDGDVVIHALIDSLCGALAAADIGEHFPDNDPAYKNADSRVLLQKFWQTFSNQGWSIINIDVTVILEKPRLSPFKELFRTGLAKLLDLNREQVSFKAKSKEGLDAVGHQQALEAWVVVLLEQKLLGDGLGNNLSKTT